MSTLTTGLAGQQQQLRSARGGGPFQAAWLSPALAAALALWYENFIFAPPLSGRGESSQRVLAGGVAWQPMRFVCQSGVSRCSRDGGRFSSDGATPDGTQICEDSWQHDVHAT